MHNEKMFQDLKHFWNMKTHVIIFTFCFNTGTAQYDKRVSNGQKLIFHPLLSEYKNTTFGYFVAFYDVIDHI